MSRYLTVDFSDGSKKKFTFDNGDSLSELFKIAREMRGGLETKVWPDRGEIRILSFQIDGYGHPFPGVWSLTRNGVDFWPEMDEFNAGPLNDGDTIVFTLKDE